MGIALLLPIGAGAIALCGFCLGFALGLHLNTQVRQISISNLHSEVPHEQ